MLLFAAALIVSAVQMISSGSDDDGGRPAALKGLLVACALALSSLAGTFVGSCKSRCLLARAADLEENRVVRCVRWMRVPVRPHAEARSFPSVFTRACDACALRVAQRSRHSGPPQVTSDYHGARFFVVEEGVLRRGATPSRPRS
eukprot:6196588-Pleurochrysis_carterae.AAC.5